MASGARAWGERAGESLGLSRPASPRSFPYSSVWKCTPLSLATQYREKLDLSLKPGDFGTDVLMLWEACWLSWGLRSMVGPEPTHLNCLDRQIPAWQVLVTSLCR